MEVFSFVFYSKNTNKKKKLDINSIIAVKLPIPFKLKIIRLFSTFN